MRMCETKALNGGPERRCQNEPAYSIITYASVFCIYVCEPCLPTAVFIMTKVEEVVVSRLERL